MRYGRMVTLLGIGLLVSAAAFAGLEAPSSVKVSTTGVLQKKIEENTSDLAALHEQINAFHQQEKALDNREEEIRRTHSDVTREIELTSRLLVEMEQRERLLKKQSTVLEQDLVRGHRNFEASQKALSVHVRSMYIRGRQGQLESVLTSGSFSRFVTRMKWESLMVKLGAGLMDETLVEGQRLSSRQKQLEVSLAEIWRTREEAGEQSGRMEDLLAEQMDALRELEDERREIKGRLLELSMNEQRLTYVLSDLEELRSRRQAQETTTENQLTELAGQLEWPVRGELVRGFGRSVHPRFQTVTLNNGVNIAARRGAPVAAVASGTVEYTDRLPGFGQCVILDHGSGYYTLYAHLDRVFVSAGGETARGQVIAEVGQPESGESSQLYFEIRHGKTPLDPLDWLRSR
jgi:murein hydrolase activator